VASAEERQRILATLTRFGFAGDLTAIFPAEPAEAMSA